MRGSICIAGPLLARLKRARISLPGGCVIGARPINLHLKGFAALGAKIKIEGGYVEASVREIDRQFGVSRRARRSDGIGHGERDDGGHPWRGRDGH